MNNTKHNKADWNRFRELINQGSKPIVSHKYLDDLRSMLIQLYFHFIGNVDDEAYMADEGSIDWSYDNQHSLKKGIGDLTVSSFDISDNMFHLVNGSKEAGRWLWFKNSKNLYQDEIYCDNQKYDPEIARSGYENYGIFHHGFLFKVKDEVYGTTAEPITILKTVPNVQYSNIHEDYELLAQLVPNCYYNTETQRLESKIHFDTWIKNFSGGYKENDCVSMQGGWKAKRDIVNHTTPPHLWNKGGRIDITKSTDINYEAGDVWQSQVWPKGSLVLDEDGITVWEALQKVENSTEYPNIQSTSPTENDFWTEREDLAVEWEKLSSEYVIDTDSFGLAPSYNYLHDWSPNSLCTARYYDKQESTESITECHPSLLFPQSVDPYEQYAYIKRAYKETSLTNLSGQTDPLFSKDGKFKYAFNASYITNANRLGAVFEANRWRSWQELTSPFVWHYYQSCDSEFGDSHALDFRGNQFCNYGGKIELNVPDTLADAVWRRNPNNCGSLQNFVNMILSDEDIRLPATATFKTNWMKRWYDPVVTPVVGGIYYDAGGNYLKKCTSTSPVTYVAVELEELEAWHTHPSVSDECWGFNEAGIELFLYTLGRYDYMFDTWKPYFPSSIGLMAEKTKNGDKGGTAPFPEVDDCTRDWHCDTPGTWRLTHKYSCKRPLWMRSYEMGLPDHYRDDFAPGLANGTWVCYIDDSNRLAEDKWYGSYTIDMPLISYFDDKFEDITPVAETETGEQWSSGIAYRKGTVIYDDDDGETYFAKQNITDTTNPPASNSQYEPVKYSFYVDGNRENNATDWQNIKVGWMVHLFNMDGAAYPAISETSSEMKTPFVLRVKYDSVNDRTMITVSEPVFCGASLSEAGYFLKVGWNKEISDRHDGFAVDFSFTDGAVSYKVYYQLHPEILIDLYDMLNLVQWKQINLPTLTYKGCVIAGSYSNSTGGSLKAATSQAKAIAQMGVSKYNDPDDWPVTYTEWYDSTPSPQIHLVGSFQVYSNVFDIEIGTTLGGDQGLDRNLNTKQSSSQYSYECIAFKITNFEVPLKNLPDKLAIRIKCKSLNKNSPQNVFAQTCGGQSNKLFNPGESSKDFYWYVYGDVGGQWYVMRPDMMWTQYRDWTTDNGIIYNHLLNGEQKMGFEDLRYTTYRIMVGIDYSIINEDFFIKNYVHMDAPRALIIDNQPPFPTPHHVNNSPYAKLELILPYNSLTDEDEDGLPDDAVEWVKGDDYYTDDVVWRPLNGKNQVYIAKNDIVNTDLRPEANPAEWEWQEPHVELRIYAESGVCQDREGSDPVKYRLLCKEDSSLDTEFTSLRNKTIIFKNIPLVKGNAGAIYFSSGTMVKLYYTGDLDPDEGDIIEIIAGTNQGWMGQYEIELVGTDGNGSYIIFDTGMGWDSADEGITLTYSLIINCTKTYNEDMWDAEVLSDEETLLSDATFAFQAKDSANDIQGVADNLTDIGYYVQLTPPADFEDFWD